MPRFVLRISILLTAAVLIGCPSSKPVREGFERNPGDLPLHERRARLLPPGAMKFDATVVTVFSDRSTTLGDPCATSPCIARIQVTLFHMFGYGVSGVHDGDFFRTKFLMTMSDTTIDGKMYRGLKEGDSFTGTGYLLATPDGQVLEVHDYE